MDLELVLCAVVLKIQKKEESRAPVMVAVYPPHKKRRHNLLLKGHITRKKAILFNGKKKPFFRFFGSQKSAEIARSSCKV